MKQKVMTDDTQTSFFSSLVSQNQNTQKIVLKVKIWKSKRTIFHSKRKPINHQIST